MRLGSKSVFRRFFGFFDDDHFDRAFLRFEFEAQPFLKCREYGGRSGVCARGIVAGRLRRRPRNASGASSRLMSKFPFSPVSSTTVRSSMRDNSGVSSEMVWLITVSPIGEIVI
jgi:hypothetical protein